MTQRVIRRRKNEEEVIIKVGDAEPFDWSKLSAYDKKMLAKNSPKLFEKIMHMLRTGEGVIDVSQKKEE